MKINPDGVDIRVHIAGLKVGMSMFVPCINTTKAKQQLQELLSHDHTPVTFRVCVQDGMYGLRMWYGASDPSKRRRPASGRGRKKTKK